jgi:hypothetical protein
MPQDGSPVRQGTRHNAMLPLARNLESGEGMTARFGVAEALGIAMIQRSAVLANMADGKTDPAAPKK